MAGRSTPSAVGLSLAYAAPLGYVATLVSVTVHEVVGHGAVALLFGGRFTGLAVHLDGMGLAWTDAPESRVAVLAGGIVATTLIGAALLVVGLRTKRPLAGLSLGVLAAAFLHDGLPYGFWDAVYQGGVGDVGRILALQTDPGALRVALIVTLGFANVAAFWLPGLVLWRAFERLVGPLSLRAAWAVATALTAGLTLGYASFDWDQLVPGVGIRPVVAAAVLQALVGVGLVRRRRRDVEPTGVSTRAWCASIVGVVCAVGLSVASIVLWLQDGVHWG